MKVSSTLFFSKMSRKPFLYVLLLFIVLQSGLVSQLAAQPQLERISAIERSDGKGFVVRHHLTQMVDSFKVVHSAPDFLQIRLYSPGLDTLNYQPFQSSNVFSEVNIHLLTDGIGIDMYLGEGHYFNAQAYPDQNQKDLLLGLERRSIWEIESATAAVDPLVWENPTINDYTFAGSDDDSFLNLHNDMDFNVIVLDAGHGGHDPGSNLIEKQVALNVTLKVGKYIEEHMPGVEVVYTRDDDRFIPLEDRGLMATRTDADLFVSIHANSSRSSQASGAEVYFLGLEQSESALEVMKKENSVVELEDGNSMPELSEEELLIYELANAGNIAISERIAAMIESQFRTRAQRRSRGVKQARFVVLWHASTPAVLVELGFLSNPAEARYLKSEYGQNILASAIFRAIRDFKQEYDKSLQKRNTASNE